MGVSPRNDGLNESKPEWWQMMTVSVDTGGCWRQDILLAMKSPRLTGLEAP